MSLTQLASIYTGATNQTEALERMTSVSTKIGEIIHITHAKDDTILDIITAKHVIDDEQYSSKVDNTDLYDFSVLGERNYDEHLKKGNRIIIPSEYENEYSEYVIDRVDDTRNNRKNIDVFCYASYLDLAKSKVIEPFTFKGTAEQHLARALAGTEHELGVIESASDITISFSNHTNPYEYVKRIAMEFKLEHNFRILHNGTRVTNRVVDLVERIGAFRGREITFGKDLQEIKRSESGDIFTALIGLSPEDENGNRKEVFVEDFNALSIWGRPDKNGVLQHLIGVYEPQSERDDMTLSQLRQYTQTELNKRISAIINYEIKFLDLEHIIGHSEKIICFGDTIRIKDTKFNPPLYIEARIFGMRRSVVRPMQKEYVLGDFVEYSEVDVKALFNQIKRLVDKKANIALLKEYAEPKRIESPTAPTGQNEHVIWVDTSRNPYVAKVFNNGKWEKLSPTVPGEIGAYTKSEVDKKAKEEAEQARKDAEAFARNADNIKQGVIDVGQVPIRTSVTGARIEWDGVNGLVQYDSADNPVSWLDLEGNAHFSNAFLSGRIEASEGYFGDNIRLRDGKMEIVRPDGAVSMSDGMAHADTPINEAFPPYMTSLRYRYGTTGMVVRSPAFEQYGNFVLGANPLYLNGAKGMIDGRGYSDAVGMNFEDVRDRAQAVVVQQYNFIHSSRYLTFDLYKLAGAKYAVMLFNGTSAQDSDRIFRAVYETNTSGLQQIIIDLGVPTFNYRTIGFKIGWSNSWGSKEEIVSFRLTAKKLTDFI